MRIARVRDHDSTWWGVIEREQIRPLLSGFETWSTAIAAGAVDAADLGPPQPLAGVELIAPLRPGAVVVAAGATYAKHVDGLGLTMPSQPAAFLKTQASVIGHEDPIAYPAITTKLDYEAELVVIIGSPDVDPAHPEQSILGYTVGNDVSARDLQFGGGVTGMDMFSAKALDGTSGLGPSIVTRDEFGDDHPDLGITLTIDGELRQSDRTSSMVWTVGELVRYVNARCSLHAGDVLYTGTCAGVGHETGAYLRPGQVVDVTIERIGSLVNTVGARSIDSN